MQIKRQNTSILVDDNAMRVYVASPEQDGQCPGILFYSDIYQLGSPITRLVDHLAGYGFVVAAPEIYHRLLPIGTIIEPDDLGRIQGNEAARKTALSEFDIDAKAIIDFLAKNDSVASGKIGTMGFCIGGHLAFRAAFNPEIMGSVCVYPTGIHNGKLGREKADSLARMQEINGQVLMIFGTLDPHVPDEGRTLIIDILKKTNITHKIVTYEANHTFMRDDGYRFDPVATDLAWREITDFLISIFSK
ncbi:dienelactone hydrolase family protein [Aphanothece sacrum]|uniref:Dienelactone hydrolase n=1 Tax=Aphanothece sacrum FPU1 TaxID=1920663 RepID=A0A401IHQ0_APHSA|nr:dienelactone hydrolase family protein [Aphanothece sacrum]GBF80671.1 dienelactone hydrolase [Aphanothece sacrum FPU1]GBF83165.1 dienelactone hydrolase [Aphanothece sacrum FPU3]